MIALLAAGMMTFALASSAFGEESGLKITIPDEYQEFVTVQTVFDNADTFIKVSETASIEASDALGETDDGAGWIFSISRVSEDTLHELRCGDMSGLEVFAKDEDNNYYLFEHPTDVRFVRESYDNVEEDMEQYNKLNEWAFNEVRDAILAENENLTPVTYSNTILDIYLAHAAFKNDIPYVLSTLEFLELEPGDFDSSPYLEKLTEGVIFQYTDKEAPDGEYAVLNFTEEGERFDFFMADENMVRRVQTSEDGEEYEECFEAIFTDDSLTSTGIMLEWYDALAKDQGLK